MKSTLIYLLVVIVAMSIGFFTMQWFNKPAVNTAPLLNAAAASSTSSSSVKAPVLTLPEFSLKDRDGKLTSIRSWPGKSLVVNFWATWCEPCRHEMPLLVKLQQQHEKDGFQVVGIAIDFRDPVIQYIDTMHIQYPVLIGEQDGMEAADAFGVDASGLPFTVFTDKQGNIITTHLGELHTDQLNTIINAIERANRGEQTVEAVRTQINLALSSSADR